MSANTMPASTRRWIIGLGAAVGVLALVLVVLLLQGSGGDADAEDASTAVEEPAVPSSPPATDPSSPATSAPPVETSPAPEPEEPTDLAAPPEGALDLASFALPSRNIACTLDESAVTCQIADAEFTPPPGEDCEFRGQVVTLADDGVALPCPDGPAAAAGEEIPVLEYGQSTSVGRWACTSSESGVECSSLADGTRFTLARAALTTDGPGAIG
ncbi:hypothetical protein [Litorihabitans aurantiacus]|uniref:Uncharacterized protein n=1 Tax=Litorihabitans aurantiacus TaxID=1930061 RepID=A0AA38CU71_9MICO|nr:hypothetical protein [Litorihabitans aurantiacus]GMA31900.1 hypothetical protein GCM10025875_18920 [Litorihabitans aurantiacus]